MNRTVIFVSALVSVALLMGCQSNPPRPDVYEDNRLVNLNVQLGLAYMREREYELSLERLNKALAIAPDYYRVHSALGTLHESLGEMDKAASHYQRAVALNAQDSQTRNNYGAFLCRKGDAAAGEKEFLSAISNPLYKNPELAYQNAALCMQQAGDLSKAETYFRKALERNPRMPMALINMADLSLKQNRYLPARAYLQRYLEVGSHSARSLWLGIQVERELGDRDTVSSYGMLLKGNFPDSPETQQLMESGEK